MTVVVNAHRSGERGREVARSIGGAYVEADISSPGAARGLIDAVIGRFGALDLLVNNAATTDVIPHEHPEAADRAVWRRIFEANVFGTWDLCVAAMPHLRRSPDGHVVMITWLGGVSGRSEARFRTR